MKLSTVWRVISGCRRAYLVGGRADGDYVVLLWMSPPPQLFWAHGRCHEKPCRASATNLRYQWNSDADHYRFQREVTADDMSAWS